MQQFFGKHLLMILLVIALGGAVSIAAVPSLRGPITDYIGETFGPKADTNSVDTNCNSIAPNSYGLTGHGDRGESSFNTSFTTSPNRIEVGQTFDLTYTHNIKPLSTRLWNKYYYGYQIYKAGISNLTLSLSGYFGKAITEQTFANNPDVSVTSDQDCSGTCGNNNLSPGSKSATFKAIKPSNGWFYATYSAAAKAPVDFDYNSLKYTLPGNGGIPICTYCKDAPEVSVTPDEKDSNKLLVKTIYQDNPISSDVNVVYYRLVSTSKGKVLSQYGSEKISTSDDGTFNYKITSNPELVKISFSSTWKCIESAKVTDYYLKGINLRPVDPNDDVTTKITAMADGKDKIKIKIDFTNLDGTINNAQNVEVYSSGGKLSMTGDNDKFFNYSQDSTLSLLGSREFYIIDDKSEKVTISARSLNQDGNPIIGSTNVEFKEPTLSHQVDKTDAESDGKDIITYTLFAKDVNNLPLVGAKINASFIISSGSIEYSEDPNFSIDKSKKMTVLKNDEGETLPNDPQLTKDFTTNSDGKVILYLRSKDSTMAKLTGLLHFADRNIGTDDKDFKSVDFKSPRIVLVGGDKNKHVYSQDYPRTDDNNQIIKLKFYDKDNNPVINTKINFIISGDSDDSCIIEKQTNPDNLVLPCNQTSNNFITDNNGELSVSVSSQKPGKLSIIAQGQKDKLIESNKLDIEFIAESFSIAGKTTAPANGITPVVITAKLSDTGVVYKIPPKISFQINSGDRIIQTKLNTKDNWQSLDDPNVDWQSINHYTKEDMFIKDKDYARLIYINTDKIGEYELVATVTLENGKTYQVKKTIQFLDSNITINPIKITRKIKDKDVVLDFQKTKDSQTPVYPGDKIKFEVSSKYYQDDQKTTIKIDLPKNVKYLPDNSNQGVLNETDNSVKFKNENKPIDFEVELNNDIPIEVSELKFTANLLSVNADDQTESQISKSNTSFDLWSKIKGQVTEPYAITNSGFVLSDKDNRPVQNMRIHIESGQGELLTNDGETTTDQEGRFEYTLNRKSLGGDYRAQFKLLFTIVNNKLFTNSDEELIKSVGKEAGSTRFIVSEPFKLKGSSVITQDFKIRDKNSEPKIAYPDDNSELLEENKTLLSVFNNILEAMKITKGYLPDIGYKTLTIQSEKDNDEYIPKKFKINLSTPDSSDYASRTLKLFSDRSPSVELHEFSHYLLDINGLANKIEDASEMNMSSSDCGHCGYANISTSNSFDEGFAITNSVYLQNEIFYGNNFINWSHKALHSDGTGRNLIKIVPAFEKLYIDPKYVIDKLSGKSSYYGEDVAAASIFHLLTTGFYTGLNESFQTSSTQNQLVNFIAKEGAWFDLNLNMSFRSRNSYEDIQKNTRDFYHIIFDNQPIDMNDFYNNALQIPDWNETMGNNTFPLITKLYILGGFFSDANGNWKYDRYEKVGQAANGAGFAAITSMSKGRKLTDSIGPRPDRNMTPRVNNSYVKINLLNSSEDHASLLNIIENSGANGLIKLVDESGNLINANNNHVFSIDGLLYLTPDPEEYGEQIFITSPNSSDYIAIDNQKFWQAVNAANTNNTGIGYVAEANFNIQTADPDKGIATATPPTLEQMQAMEAEKEKAKQAEIDKALAAQKAQEEADKLAALEAQKEKDLQAQADAQAKADLQAQLDKLTQEIADANKRAQDAEEARLKALEDLKIAQEAQLAAQAAQLKAEQDKAAELARLEAEKQAEIERNQKLAEENAKLQAKLASYEKQINDLQTQLSQTQSDLANARIEKDNILNEKNKLIDELSKAKEDNQVLHQISLNLRQSVLSLEEQFKNLNIAYISQKESSEQDQLNNLLQKKNLLELTDINSETKKQLEEQLSLTSNLTKENSDLISQIESQNDQITKDQTAINQLQSDLNVTQDNLTKIQTQKLDLENQNNDLTNQLQKAKDDHNVISQINLTLQKTVNDLELKLKESQLAQAQKDEELRLEKLKNQVLEEENHQKELADLELQQQLKAKELELQSNQADKQVSVEQDKQTILNNESQNNLDKLDHDLTITKNELTQISNKIDDAIGDTPLITVKPIESTPTSPYTKVTGDKQTQRNDIKIATVKDDSTHLAGIASETVISEPLKVKTDQELIINTDNFKNTDNLTVFLDDKQIAQTPIITPQTDLKVTIPETTLGLHTITVKDDLGNKASTTFTVTQNEILNYVNFKIAVITLLIMIFGLTTVKLVFGKMVVG